MAASPAPARFIRWAAARHPGGAETRLTQRNVYVLPARGGWSFAALLAVLLMASINYQLNLGYLFAFVLAGVAMGSVFATHANLGGVELTAVPPAAPVFAGRRAMLRLALHAERRPRWNLRLGVRGVTPVAVDLAADAAHELELEWQAPQRGPQPWPLIGIETRYPFGFWRAWSWWRPGGELWVCPAPEADPPPLPADAPNQPGRGAMRDDGDPDTLRDYRPGDPMRRVVWTRARDDTLVVRAASPERAGDDVWLAWDRLPESLDTEARLARLCAWVLACAGSERRWGLRLPGVVVGPDTGQAHRDVCLRQLAAWGVGDAR